MGWTGSHYDSRERASTLDLLRRNTSYFVGNTWRPGDTVEIEVEQLHASRGVVFGVLKHTNLGTRRSVRFALIVLVERCRKNSEFLVKEMTEFEGPVETGMPAPLFNKLSPLDEVEKETLSNTVHAAEWRARVKAQLAGAKCTKNLKPGDVIELKHPAIFSHGTEKIEVSRFRIRTWGRKRTLTALVDSGDEFPCRLTRRTWQSTAFQVVV
jgi:hypothetical protein